jgi:hypothetical protein
LPQGLCRSQMCLTQMMMKWACFAEKLNVNLILIFTFLSRHRFRPAKRKRPADGLTRKFLSFARLWIGLPLCGKNWGFMTSDLCFMSAWVFTCQVKPPYWRSTKMMLWILNCFSHQSSILFQWHRLS